MAFFSSRVPPVGVYLVKLASMAAMAALYQAGADPAQSLLELAEFTHFVTRIKIAGVVEAAGDGADVRPGDRVYGTLFPAGGGFCGPDCRGGWAVTGMTPGARTMPIRRPSRSHGR